MIDSSLLWLTHLCLIWYNLPIITFLCLSQYTTSASMRLWRRADGLLVIILGKELRMRVLPFHISWPLFPPREISTSAWHSAAWRWIYQTQPQARHSDKITLFFVLFEMFECSSFETIACFDFLLETSWIHECQSEGGGNGRLDSDETLSRSGKVQRRNLTKFLLLQGFKAAYWVLGM